MAISFILVYNIAILYIDLFLHSDKNTINVDGKQNIALIVHWNTITDA